MRDFLSWDAVKKMADQLFWELIGSIFIAVGICGAGKISDDGLFRDFDYFVSFAACAHWVIYDYIKYSGGDFVLSAAGKEIFYQFPSLYGAVLCAD